jgi:hypothetical protein
MPTANDQPQANPGKTPEVIQQVVILAGTCSCGKHDMQRAILRLGHSYTDDELLQLGTRLCRTVPGIGEVYVTDDHAEMHFTHGLLGEAEDVRARAYGIAEELGLDPDGIKEETVELKYVYCAPQVATVVDIGSTLGFGSGRSQRHYGGSRLGPFGSLWGRSH